MADGLYIAVSGAKAQSEALDVTANNVANANTTGFKGEKVSFGEVLTSTMAQNGGRSYYVAISGMKESTEQGSLVTTHNPLDLALVGDGFFGVDTARGTRYTRAGSFRLSVDGTIVDPEGNVARAAGGGGIQVPSGAKEVRVDPDGTVYADGLDVGGLELVRFAPGTMQREGKGFYSVLPTVRPLDAKPEVVGGSLESSNVSGVRGVVDMVKLQRTYDALLQIVESFQQVDQRTVREIGGAK